MEKLIKCKFIFGLAIGILSVSIVCAADSLLSSSIFYDNVDSGLASTDIQSAIDELSIKITYPTSCKEGYYCEKLKTTLEVGDYVSYTPTTTSFTTSTTYTGYSSTQTIYPSELNLWRVLKINDDRTVEIIPEYATSTCVNFMGKTGYLNYVGYLNELASKYETPGITVGSRHFGYDNQTGYITDTQYFESSSSPWSCSTGGTCSPAPDDYETYGGGDKGYLTDYNLVNTVLGTRSIRVKEGIEYSYYYIATRYYAYASDTNYYLQGRYYRGSTLSTNSFYVFSTAKEYSLGCLTLRPIVVLSGELSYEGLGTYSVPMEIVA